MLSPKAIAAKVVNLEASFSERDRRHRAVGLVRGGNMASVFPDLFGTISDQPFVANFIDVVARDMSEMIGPLPALNCVSGSITSDRARAFGAKRQQIGLHYWLFSNLRQTVTPAADKYLTYGYVPAKVEPNWKHKTPQIRFLDPRGGYPEFDNIGNTVSYTQKKSIKASALAALYPHLKDTIIRNDGKSFYTGEQRDQDLTVYTYEDGEGTLVYCQERDDLVLEQYENRLGECAIQCAVRPSPDDEMRGQFDDVLGVEAAKAYLARLSLEAAEKTVQAPLVVPSDVVDVPLGPDAIIRTDNPQGVGRLKMDVGNSAILQNNLLDAELRMGTRYPEGRSGQVQGSIVTGRGVEALLGTFDTQIKTHQTVFGDLLRRLTSLCFKLDELYWPNERKDVRGSANGVPFAIAYTPSRDINGDYTCDVTYGMMAGMDPNRGLVFILQALGAGLLDRETAMLQMPFDIDVTQLIRNIEVEKMREAGLAGLQATAQAIGPIIEQGGDASALLHSLALAIADRQQGKTLEAALLRFAPPPPPPTDPNAPPGAPPGPGGPAGELPPGQSPSGLLAGVAPGQAGQAPGGRPALQNLLAQITGSGKPNLTAGVRRAVPV